MPPFASSEQWHKVLRAGSTGQNDTASTVQWVEGWVQQPASRGTWDIIVTCIITVSLCSWSALFLNLHPKRGGRDGLLRNKLRWMLFTLFWPEVTVGTAFDQWESARQSVKDFYQASYPQWTMRHAFFAEMGGFVLQSPGFPPFPVNCQQLLYLIEKGYVAFPEVDTEIIWDKNKADGFARAVTLVQIVWFSVQVISRAIQHLQTTILELLTISFIFCTLNMFFFWHHKPLDAQTPIYIHTDRSIADIIREAGDLAKKRPYELTPLDFLTAAPTRENFVATWWWGVTLCFNGILFEVHERKRPVHAIANSSASPPHGYTLWTMTCRVALLLRDPACWMESRAAQHH